MSLAKRQAIEAQRKMVRNYQYSDLATNMFSAERAHERGARKLGDSEERRQQLGLEQNAARVRSMSERLKSVDKEKSEQMEHRHSQVSPGIQAATDASLARAARAPQTRPPQSFGRGNQG